MWKLFSQLFLCSLYTKMKQMYCKHLFVANQFYVSMCVFCNGGMAMSIRFWDLHCSGELLQFNFHLQVVSLPPTCDWIVRGWTFRWMSGLNIVRFDRCALTQYNSVNPAKMTTCLVQQFYTLCSFLGKFSFPVTTAYLIPSWCTNGSAVCL